LARKLHQCRKSKALRDICEHGTLVIADQITVAQLLCRAALADELRKLEDRTLAVLHTIPFLATLIINNRILFTLETCRPPTGESTGLKRK
jgi:hypothetical protein